MLTHQERAFLSKNIRHRSGNAVPDGDSLG